MTVGGTALTSTQTSGGVIIGDGSSVVLSNKSSVTFGYPSILEYQGNIYMGDNVSWSQSKITQIIAENNWGSAHTNSNARTYNFEQNLYMNASGLNNYAFELSFTGSKINVA